MYYHDMVKDALYPKKRGVITKRNKYLKAEDIPEMTGDQVRKLRESLSLSLSVFASLLGVQRHTVQCWESGSAKPSGSALRLMQMIKRDPDILFDTHVFRSINP